MESVLEAAAEVLRNNESAVLCTVVRSEGSTPRHVGSKMLVFPDGHFVGTVGGGELEHRVIGEACKSLTDGVARTLHYDLADPKRGDPGVCGGQVEVFVEPLRPSLVLLIIGVGHVGKAVAHLGKWLQFRIVASDDRAEFCNKESIPAADEFHVCPMAELPGRMKINEGTFIVLTTRGTSVDVVGLPDLLRSKAAYIGVIGSKRRWATTARELRAQGVGESELARVHSPVGLELQAETPEEIAVSILAEILLHRNRASGQSMRAGATAASARQP